MDSDRWERIERIFHEAIERPAAEREAFLRKACGDDEGLRAEVRALIDADATPHSLLAGRAIDAVAAPQAASLPAGTRVGAYRVVSPIGKGGMGVVYLAERADGEFEQRVALKLVKRGMDSESILARFRSERRILARLQHSNIAGLLDGGVTEDGVPFFTMEYVDGQPITQYCDEQVLTIDERLDLFLLVCAAVQYAHGNLVVHRDLKPSNIMVTRDGQVKLLDFGIARVLDDEEEGLTRSGQRVMTPAYASPEQVRGEPVTTASDVYSLGVVLYEILCGRHPHRDTTATPAELERAISEAPAERPSRFAVGGTNATASSTDAIARARGTGANQLRKRLQGDLDTICLVALRKEVDRRYSSPGHMADDIRRHLSGKPVSARPDTLRYRFWKFVVRNRVGVAATAAVVTLVTALTVLYTIRLASERDRARLEAAKATEVSAFLSGLFEAADPYTSRGESVTARELLDEGSDRVREELRDQPEVLAEMLFTIGTAYGNLGLYDQAIAALEESRALRIGIAGENDEATVETTVSLWGYMNNAARYREAEDLGKPTVAIARALPDKRMLAEAASKMAFTLDAQGRFDEADPYYRESIAVWRTIEGPRSPSSAGVLNDLALLLHQRSRYAEADSIFLLALSIEEEAFGRRHPETATTRYNYAQLLADRGYLSDARAMWDEVLATDRALYPDGHPAIAFTLSAFGRLLSRIGEYDEAEKLQREALAIRRSYHGEEHADVAYSLGSLGRALYDEGHYEEAERYMRESYAMHARINGPEHPVLSYSMIVIGWIEYTRGDYAAADSTLREAQAFLQSILGNKDTHDLAVLTRYRAHVLEARGHLAEAEALAREGLAMSLRVHGDQGSAVAAAKTTLGDILVARGGDDEAEELFDEALGQMRALEKGEPARPRDVPALLGLGTCRLSAGDVAGAERRFREALEIEREYLREDHPGVARTEIALARTSISRGDEEAAVALLRSAVDRLSGAVMSRQRDLVEARALLAGLTTSRDPMPAVEEDAPKAKRRP